MKQYDRFVVSYPRSGANWIMSMLSMVMFGKALDVSTLRESPDLEEQIARHTHGGARPWGNVKRMSFKDSPWGADRLYHAARVVVIFRDPRDSTLSVWRWITERIKPKPRKTLFSEFLRSHRGLRYNVAWMRWWEGKLQRKVPAEFLVLYYEDLCRSPGTGLANLLSFFGLPTNDVDTAIDACAYDRLVATSHHHRHTWRIGGPGGFDRIAEKRDKVFAQQTMSMLDGPWTSVYSQEK